MRPFTILRLAVIVTPLLLGSCGGSGGGGGLGGALAADETPYADMYNGLGHPGRVPVRGRIVQEDDAVDITDTSALRQISQSEIKNRTARLALVSEGERYDLGEVRTDEEGYIDTQLRTDASPGQYTLEVTVDGALAGAGTMRLLAPDNEAVVVRSDVDLTYLDTDFMSNAGLVDLLRAKAGDRQALPAMETIYTGLRAGGPEGDRPLVFLSGSPRFFKRVLEGKMQLDGVRNDGLVLKPFKDIVVDNILDFDVHQIVDELHEQIGYKLYWLLRLRLDVPPGTGEILMGDDSEADVVIYNLYYRFTAGALDPDALAQILTSLGVTEDWRALIADIAPQVKEVVAQPPVVAIYIHATGVPGETFPVAEWAIDGITRYHEGAWPLALDLYEAGWVTREDAQTTYDRLLALGQSEQDLAQRAARADFLHPETVADFNP